MRREQRQELRDKEKKKLRDASVWRVQERNVAVAVEMAMQKYAIWKTETASNAGK